MILLGNQYKIFKYFVDFFPKKLYQSSSTVKTGFHPVYNFDEDELKILTMNLSI